MMGKTYRNGYDDEFRLGNKKAKFTQIRSKRKEKTANTDWWLPNEKTQSDEEDYRQKRKPRE